VAAVWYMGLKVRPERRQLTARSGKMLQFARATDAVCCIELHLSETGRYSQAYSCYPFSPPDLLSG